MGGPSAVAASPPPPSIGLQPSTNLCIFPTVSKQTILALTPFLLAAPGIAVPVENVEREENLVKRVAWLPILEGIGIAAGLVDTIMGMADGADEGDSQSSAPKPLQDIAPEPGRPKRTVEVVCITDQKPANPVWFRTRMRARCEKIVNEKPTAAEERYKGMIADVWTETADWGQELKFEMAW